MNVFTPAQIGSVLLQNRIIRSATFEGMCNQNGVPTKNYKDLYITLARNNIGGIITGFMYISQDGKAMQPGQAGIDADSKASCFKEINQAVHQYGSKIFAQLAHAGRQTKANITGTKVVGASTKKSFYFNETPQQLTLDQAYQVIEKFADAALLAKQAGFDGIQLHAAHGYLIHQFILPSINSRNDLLGVDYKTKIGTKFLELIIEQVRVKCGAEFPILVKISSSDDYWKRLTIEQYINLIHFLDRQGVAAIEVSYGTMDYALNIFRGEIPIDLICEVNPVYHIDNLFLRRLWKAMVFPLLKLKIKPFTPNYNLPLAQIAKQHTRVPIICVGGFRQGNQIIKAIDSNQVDFISLSRPFICEPDFVNKLKSNHSYISKCINCNYCSIMCDSEQPTRCYQRGVIN